MSNLKSIGVIFLTAAFTFGFYIAVSAYGQARFIAGAQAYERWLIEQRCERGSSMPKGATKAKDFETSVDTGYTS